VANALGFRFYQDIKENEWVISSISDLFSFQRNLPISGGNDPIPQHTDRDYCINLGLLARRRMGKGLTEEFTKYGKYLKDRETVDDLVAFVLDRDIEVIFDKIQDEEKQEFLIRPEAYLFFLKWKDKFFENSRIDWEGIKSDLRRLLEANKKEICRQTLFLLTCYAGPSSLSNLPPEFKNFTKEFLLTPVISPTSKSDHEDLILRIVVGIILFSAYSLFAWILFWLINDLY